MILSILSMKAFNGLILFDLWQFISVIYFLLFFEENAEIRVVLVSASNIFSV